MAGPPFEFYSTPRLSTQLKTRWLILLERLQNTAAGIAAHSSAHPRLGSIAEKILWLRENIQAVLDKEFAL